MIDHHIWHVLTTYFVWPFGLVWGNVWAIIPCGLVAAATAYFGRHKIGKMLVKWWHKHMIEHVTALEAELKAHEAREHEQNGHMVQTSP